MKQLKTDIKNNPSKMKRFFLEQFAGYYDGQLYRFATQHGALTLVPAKLGFVARLLIVSPSCYQERTLDFPLDDRNEIKKLLKLQLGLAEVFLIQNSEQGLSKVNAWLFSKTVPTAFIRLPESLLLGILCKNGHVLKTSSSNEKVNYITRFDGVIHSAAMQGIINSADRFAMSTGLPIEQITELKFKDKALALANTLTKLNFIQLVTFIRKITPKSSKLLLAQITAPLITIITLYLLITSGYLLMKTNFAENKLVENSEQVSRLLKLQTLVDKKQMASQKLTRFLQKKHNFAGLWVVLAPIFKQVTIKNIILQNDKFLISGQTKKASSLLESISNNPNVTHAKFERPVRKNRNNESFNLSFKLAQDLIVGGRKPIKMDKGLPNE